MRPRYIIRTSNIVSYHESKNDTVTVLSQDIFGIDKEEVVVPLWLLLDLSYELKLLVKSRKRRTR